MRYIFISFRQNNIAIGYRFHRFISYNIEKSDRISITVHNFQEHVLRKYVVSFVVETRLIYIFIILHCLSCSTMWSSAHRGQRSPDWSEAFALWHTLCGALPVRWRFPPAPHSHHQVSRQRQMGPAQDHLYEVWVSQLYSLNVNLKNQMARLILFFFVSSARRSHRYRRHHHKSHHERRKHKRHGSGGHRGQQEGHGHF